MSTSTIKRCAVVAALIASLSQSASPSTATSTATPILAPANDDALSAATAAYQLQVQVVYVHAASGPEPAPAHDPESLRSLDPHHSHASPSSSESASSFAYTLHDGSPLHVNLNDVFYHGADDALRLINSRSPSVSEDVRSPFFQVPGSSRSESMVFAGRQGTLYRFVLDRSQAQRDMRLIVELYKDIGARVGRFAPRLQHCGSIPSLRTVRAEDRAGAQRAETFSSV